MMRKPKQKQRWARLTEAEQARVEDLGQPFDEAMPPLKRGPNGSLWADSILLAAYRSQHTSGVSE
jgi:hypothetical protein